MPPYWVQGEKIWLGIEAERFEIHCYARRYDKSSGKFILAPADILIASPAEAEEITMLFDTFFSGSVGFLPNTILREHIRRRQIYIFRYHGKIIAAAIGRPHATLWDLLVHPDWQGKGLGQALVQHLKPQKIRVKYKGVAKDPTPFYQKLGYQVVETVVPQNFWPGGKWHCKGKDATIKIMER